MRVKSNPVPMIYFLANKFSSPILDRKNKKEKQSINCTINEFVLMNHAEGNNTRREKENSCGLPSL